MTSTRRQFTWMLAAAAGLSGRAMAAADDDDSPANVFISPCGKPFRAPIGAPYPVGAWFKEADKNGDGKLDHAEFLADTEAFFNVLDLTHQNVLTGFDIQVYERRIAPEVLGYRVDVGALRLPGRPGRGHGDGRLWLTQLEGPPTGVLQSAPADPEDLPKTPQHLDESNTGASPYSFFEEPEPVTAADLDLRGYITKANFLRLADMHFHDLDTEGAGFLTLDKLPKTPAQRKLERKSHRR